jgi:outer membrane protein insertion porin family
MRLLKNIIVFTELRRRSVTPDSASSRNNRLTNNDITDIEFGFQYDTRDYRLNPMSGLFYKASITYGLKKVNGPAYIIEEDNLRVRDELQSYEMYFEWYQNIWHNQVFSLKLSGMHISGSNIQMSDYFWFGGFRTLRGYRENQFSGDKAAWANLEYRFLVGKNSRVFLFNDWGFVDSPQVSGSLLPGYGMGIRFETGIGILEVDYGLGKGDGFGEGKIHFGVINNF